MGSPTGSSVLPPLDECLFGPTRHCPKTLTSTEEEAEKKFNDNDDENSSPPPSSTSASSNTNTNTSKSNNNSNNNMRSVGMDVVSSYDSLYMGHWADAAQQHDINIAKLRRICSQGIADEGSFRGICWRVLLGYLPTKEIHESWPKTVQPQRELYCSLIQQYLANRPDPGRELRGSLSKRLQKHKNLRQNFDTLKRLDEEARSDDDDNEEELNESIDDGGTDDDDGHRSAGSTSPPPQSDPTEMTQSILDKLPSQFQEQWKKSGIRLDKSVATQTAASLGINHLQVPAELQNQEEFDVFLQDAQLLEEIRKDVVRTHPDLYFFLEPQANLGLRRYAAIERILFIWSKLNRGVRYVQGMNEIVGTIYYVLANDHNSDWAIHAEADTYFLFHTLMIEMRDVFVPDLDTSDTGIQGRIDNMQRLLQTHDPEVYEHLQECSIDASFFAIRWLTTLLSREFLLPDTIRLWDSMFASTHKENFLRYVCGTMVMLVREDLLKGDFSSCLRLLQSFPPANVDDILESSRSLWIYESQINIACHKGGISLHQALQTVSPPPAIIMAFGLKGGVAPRIQEQIRETAHNVQEGLLGRAKRIWSGWGAAADGDEATTQQTTAAATGAAETSTQQAAAAVVSEPASTAMNGSANNRTDSIMASLKAEAAAAPTPAPPPARRRIWNRGRSNTNESNQSNHSGQNLAALSGEDETEKMAPDTAVEAAPTPPARSRLWNRGRSNESPASSSGGTPNTKATNIFGSNPAATTTPPPNLAPAAEQITKPPPRARFWNRGRSDQTTTTTTSTTTTLPVS